MRKISFRELHIRTSALREAEAGGVIGIECRGEPVAELRPIAASPQMPADKKAGIFADMRKIWAKMPKVGDSTKIVRQDRDR